MLDGALVHLQSLLIKVAALIIGLSVHESAHAVASYLLGDSTARARGRVSLNPLAHIDPFGTVLLPLLMLLAGGPVFAFAKPVPVYLGNLKHPKRDEVLVSLAGPASNLVLAVAFAWLMGVIWSFALGSMQYGTVAYTAWTLAVRFCTASIVLNLSLAFFNLIPLPPLDGSSILAPLLRGDALRAYYRVQRYSMPILICVLYLIPMVSGIDLIGIYFDHTVYPLANMLLSVFAG